MLDADDLAGRQPPRLQRAPVLPAANRAQPRTLGVRDPRALEAALFRPQTGYYEDIVAEAAALIESLAINHPFVDGNKRIAFAAVDVFLRINGWRLQRAPTQIYAAMMQMFEAGTFDIAHLDPWLRGFAKAEGA